MDRRDFIKLVGIGVAGTALWACGVDPNTQTLTPTEIAPTSTKEIPEIPSATPTEVETPLPEGIGGLQEKIKETDYSLGWSKEDKEKIAFFYTDNDGNKTEVPEIVVKEDGSWTRAYNLPDIAEKFVVEGTMAEMEIILDEDGTKNLGFYNWKVENGGLKLKTKGELELHSLDEAKKVCNFYAVQIQITDILE